MARLNFILPFVASVRPEYLGKDILGQLDPKAIRKEDQGTLRVRRGWFDGHSCSL